MKTAEAGKAAPPWHFSVLIPARNEEDLLPRCIHSLLRAKAALPSPVRCDIVLAVDCSEDRTWEIGRRMLKGHGMVTRTEAGVVGHARALAASIALERCNGPMERCWLANTDADCVLPDNWLVEQLRLAEEAFEAVAGIIDVDTFEEHASHVFDRFRATYLIRPDGSHPHVHGANLGVRADAYLRAGGWRDFATAEDHDLWGRLVRTGARTLQTSRLKLLTSGRRQGRAPQGFAETLARHNESAA